mgnify:CR=1 FL=1
MPIYFNEINYLSAIFTWFSIPHEMHECYDGWQITFPWCKGDIACHSGTFGSEQHKVETYCFPWDEGDVTTLSTTAAAMKIGNYYFDTIGES